MHTLSPRNPLLCNSPSIGLCNRRRLYVPRIRKRVVECEILAGKRGGNMIFIPRIHLSPSSPLDMSRFSTNPVSFMIGVCDDNKQGTTSNSQVRCTMSHGTGAHMNNYMLLFRVSWMMLRMIVSDMDADYNCSSNYPRYANLYFFKSKLAYHITYSTSSSLDKSSP